MNVTLQCMKCHKFFEITREMAAMIYEKLASDSDLAALCPDCGEEILKENPEIAKKLKTTRITNIANFVMQALMARGIPPDDETKLALKLLARTVEVGIDTIDPKRVEMELEFLMADETRDNGYTNGDDTTRLT